MTMNRSAWLKCLSAGMAIGLAGTLVAQPPATDRKKDTPPVKAPATPAGKPEATKVQPKDPKADAAMEAMMAAAQPGENHKLLEKFVGKWEGTCKMWQAPGETPMESTATVNHRMEFGGRFLYSRYEGDFQGDRFEGVGVIGYNNVLKTFQTSWLCNMSTGLECIDGKYDPATKAFTFSGEMTCPEEGRAVNMRNVIRWTGENTYVEEMYRPGPDGKDFKAMEINYKRTGPAGEARGHDKDKEKDKGKPTAR